MLIFAVILFVAGCAPKYKIITDPPGAKVTINGEWVGETPIEAKVHCATWGGRPIIDIRKDGFQTISGQELKFEPHVGIILADALLFWPALFLNSQCPKDEYNFKLEPVVASK
jgi:hypothetical protein